MVAAPGLLCLLLQLLYLLLQHCCSLTELFGLGVLAALDGQEQRGRRSLLVLRLLLAPSGQVGGKVALSAHTRQL